MPRNRDRRGRFDFKHNWSVRQVKKHPKATLSVLGILVALVGILFFTGSTPGSTPDFDLDFEEVVNPTRQVRSRFSFPVLMLVVMLLLLLLLSWESTDVR